jgi:hypothetical protein
MTLTLMEGTEPQPHGSHPCGARLLILLLAISGVAPPAHSEPNWSDIEALFSKRCIMCHSGDHAARGLKLDSYEGTMAGGENGSVLVPGDILGSELVRRVRGESKPRMPFLSYPLIAEEISLIERWIEAGSPREGKVEGE